MPDDKNSPEEREITQGTPDDDREAPGQPGMPADEDILEIELDEEQEIPPASAGNDDIINIDLADLPEDPPVAADACASSAGAAFPEVTAGQYAAAMPGITIPVLCAATGKHYAMRYQQREDGDLHLVEVITEASSFQPAAQPLSTVSVQGSFHLSKEYCCPFCQSRGVLVCGSCGHDMCAGGKTVDGGYRCPNCNAVMRGFKGSATTATGFTGSKGKQTKT